MIESNDIIAYNAYPDIEGITPIGNFRGAQLWDIPKEEHNVLFVAVDDAAQLFKLITTPEYADKRYSLVSCASDFSVVLQDQNNFWKDALAQLEYIADVNWNEYRDRIIRMNMYDGHLSARIGDHFKEKCDPFHKYSVKNWNCTYYTFPEIPSNIVSWHQTNLSLCDERCKPLPFGVSPQDREPIATIAYETRNQARQNSVYVNIQGHTIERARILKQLRSNPYIDGMTITLRDGGLDKATYLGEIAAHQYVLCWDGMGIDSYRTWETYYLGARPIVSHRMANILVKLNLPYFLWYTDANELYEYTTRTTNYESLRMSHWKGEFFK